MGPETILIYSGIGLVGGMTSYICEKCNRPDLAVTADRVTVLFLVGTTLVLGYFLHGALTVFM